MSKDRLIKKIVLPFPLPLWNRLLGMSHWGRKNIRHWLHPAVSIFIPRDGVSLTSTEYLRKQQLMHSFLPDYWKMMGRRLSTLPQASAKKKSVKKKSKKQ